MEPSANSEPILPLPTITESPPTFPDSPPPPPPQTRRKVWVAVIAIAVVAVLLVGILAFTGVFSSSGPGATGPIGTPESYREAIVPAISAGNEEAGGPWGIIAAEGFGLPSGITEPNVAGFVGNGCAFTPEPGGQGVLVLPGTPTNATPGAVATWIFFAKNASLEAILLIVVSNGGATVMGAVTGSGSGCTGTFTGLNEINVTGDVDSTAVAAEFDQNGGTGFLGSNAVATESFILIGASSATGGNAFWEVEYTTCAFTATGGSGNEEIAGYYASTGESLSGPTNQSTTC
jgi:hypothetical protein